MIRTISRFAGLAMLAGAAFPAAGGQAPVSLSSGEYALAVSEDSLAVTHGERRLLTVTDILFNFSAGSGWEVVESDNARIVLTGQFPAAADFYRVAGDEAPRRVELVITTVAGGFRVQAHPDWGRHVTLVLESLGGHFFGLAEPLLPDNRLSPDLTGTVIDVDVHSEGAQWRENYASAWSAFYINTLGYGAFFDTFARGRYELAINGRTRIHHDTGKLDWYILPGRDGREIHAAYFGIIGAPKPVPAWALGPVGWRDHNESSSELLDDIERLTALRMPFTAWFVDRPYSDGAHDWSQMNFSARFSDPGDWIGELEERFNLRFMTWASPATFGDRRFARHLPGAMSYIDLSDPESADTYKDNLRTRQYRFGVRGHKIDRGDEYFPFAEAWHDASVTLAERRNRYAWLMARTHDEALRQTWGDDQVTFARAAWHRTQPYLSAIWAGDPRSTFAGLQGNFANGARAAFLGFPVWGSDIGGYQGEGFIPADLYLRWMQAGSMSGFFEIKLDGAGGEGRDRMPWQYDRTFQAQYRTVLEDRMRFLPYLYSLARTAGKTGTLMQPLAYRHFDDANTYDAWDQFYVGDGLMVAPVFEAGTRRSVYFPNGVWRDLDQPAQRIEGGRSIVIEAPLDKLPRFVRENSIFVTGNLYRGNTGHWESGDNKLTIHVLPGPDNASSEFAYVDMHDKDRRKPITLNRTGDEVRVTAPAMPYDVEVRLLTGEAAKSVPAGTAVDVSFHSPPQW